jgi:hypothetical protein
MYVMFVEVPLLKLGLDIALKRKSASSSEITANKSLAVGRACSSPWDSSLADNELNLDSTSY